MDVFGGLAALNCTTAEFHRCLTYCKVRYIAVMGNSRLLGIYCSILPLLIRHPITNTLPLEAATKESRARGLATVCPALARVAHDGVRDALKGYNSRGADSQPGWDPRSKLGFPQQPSVGYRSFCLASGVHQCSSQWIHFFPPQLSFQCYPNVN